MLKLAIAALCLQGDGRPIADVINTYSQDRGILERRYRAPMSEEAFQRMRRFYAGELKKLESLDADGYERLTVDEAIDWHLLKNRIWWDLERMELAREKDLEVIALLPFATTIAEFVEARQRVARVDPDVTAKRVADLADHVTEVHEKLDEGKLDDVHPVLLARTAKRLGDLRRAFGDWYRFRANYDPMFTWWLEQPHEAASKALDRLGDAFDAKVEAQSGDATLSADPIGEAALIDALRREYIPYSPAELVAIAEREFAWCDARMLEASNELGFGDDWRAAQAHVKSLYVEPGEQPYLVRDLVTEAIDFLESRELVTIPPLAAEGWRMTMISPERQKTSPYFLGGEEIQVSYPTHGMTDDEKRATLLGNNEHFARAVAHHEVIPGHGLQAFMQRRHRPYRRLFTTPFWVEGWALYWEMRLWDLGFPRGPEDRIGMLFWRKHRCARIVFSLSIHLGTMTPEEAVEYLVTRVGHEKKNAEGEVRRSVGGAYPPLYQAAYMLGGLQLRALHEELIEDGAWTERRFHDMVMQSNSIPIELLRASAKGIVLPRDYETSWRFAE